MFRGTFTAIITPFKNGKFDEAAFRNHIDMQLEGGVEGIVPVGTTGESPTLTEPEHLEVIRVAVDQVAGRGLVIAGTGANSTSEAIHLTQEAEKLGADASLQVTPYYNKPSQEGLFHHFKNIADNTAIPIMLYNVPGRSVVAIAPETAADLADACKNIIAIKEAGGDPDRVDALKNALPEGFEILSGDDPLTLEFMRRGAVGLVSVASNIIPREISNLVRAMLDNNEAKAQEIQEAFEPLMDQLMGIATNPMPIKTAASLMGLCEPEIRLPLTNLKGEQLNSVQSLLQNFKLINCSVKT